jgi:hypothetical protein
MAKNKEVTSSSIISFYMDYVLEHSTKPNSVYKFAKANNFDEQEFYKHFSSFETIEKHVFHALFENTINTLEKSKEYISFDAKNKLLSFYYTFFENLTANRSYILYALPQDKMPLKNLKVLAAIKQSFTAFIAGLDIETLDVKQEQINRIQNRALQESAWLQLLLTMKFWIDDTSSSFEKTDIFIEKSVNTSFDILAIAPLKSVIDFGKFLFKEKIHMN